MGVFCGQNSISDNIILNIDAANPLCFKGESTTNIVINSKGDNITNVMPGSYKPGWDNILHDDAITVSSWGSGYNSGVPSPTIGYHARWVYGGIDGDSDSCMLFQDENLKFSQSHRWLGISQTLKTLNELGWGNNDVITVSWYQKSSVIGKGANVGVYHKRVDTDTYGFENAQQTILNTTYGEWERASFTVSLTSNWDLNYPIMVYVYGMYGAEGKLWVDNVQIENKTYSTPFVSGTRGSTIATGGGIHDLSKKNNNLEFLGGVNHDKVKSGRFIFSGTTLNGFFRSSLNPNKFTCDFWFDGTSGYIIRRQNYGWGAYISSNNVLSTWVDVDSNHRVLSRTVPFTGITNITLTFGDFKFKIYKNGEKVHELPTSSDVVYGTELLRIGTDSNTSGFMTGSLYSLKIYDSVLNNSDIRKNYNSLKNRFK